MPTKRRYHIHVCIDRNEHPEFENALQLALTDDYFLTWDLIAGSTQLMDYSKHQIDVCDYLLFVLGSGYGHLSPSGVSNLHLSYIYANMKRKSMIALIKLPTPQVEYVRQRIDLANVIQKDLRQWAILFDETQDAMIDCQRVLGELIEEDAKSGWVKGSKPKESAQHKASKSEPITISAPAQIVETSKPTITLHADDVVLINYSAHAFQDGNLQDIMSAHIFTWGEVIDLLKILAQPFSNDMMLKQLNDSLKNLALIEASKTLPNVHAVSRCQVNAVDFQWLKQQLIDSQWLISAKEDHSTRELWRVNPNI